MKLGSLFDGSGTAPLAATLCGIEPVWASEIEPFPIAVTKKRFPNMKHYGSITELNGSKIEPVDIIVGGSPCFVKGTMVLTSDGYKEIQDVKVGDSVLSHKGNWCKVEKIGNKISQTIKLKGNQYGIRCTLNHPFLSAEQHTDFSGDHLPKRTLKNAGSWSLASEMNGKRYAALKEISSLPVPIIGDDRIRFDRKLMYVVGRWLADGWVRDGVRTGRPDTQHDHQIFICANDEKLFVLENAMKDVFYGVSNLCVMKERTVNKCRVINKPFCEWIVNNFGKYAIGKKIPGWVYGIDEELKYALLEGYIDGDGWRFKENTWKVSSISEPLIQGMRTLAETLGYSCTVHYAERSSTCVIEGRTVRQHDTYGLVISKEKKHSFIDSDKYHWYKCRSIEKNGIHRVYNLQVSEDHSYIVNGICVHNCQDLSIAGKRDGIIDGKRSSLFFEQIRVTKEMLNATNGEYPKYEVWENVPGAFSSNKGEDFRCVLEQFCKIKDSNANIPRPPKGKWSDSGLIMGNGYSVGWRVFDAQFWGVPQRRKRIYLVADFAGGSAGKILFESEGLSGYSAEGFRSWQTAAGTSAEGSGETGSYSVDGYNSSFGTGGNNQPFVLETPKTLKIRSGCEGGGKGALIQDDLSATLGCNNDQTLFVPKAYGICSKGSNSMMSDNPHSGFYEADTSRCLDANGGDPSCNQGGIAVVAIEGNGSRPSHRGDGYKETDAMYTLNATEQHGVAYSSFKASFFTSAEKELANTLVATDYKDPPIVNDEDDADYIVRRLTPTEFARLQGFPDWWCDDLATQEPTQADIDYWKEVFETHRKVMGTSSKPKSESQIIKWLKDPHSDSAEYKMWGNGMALPNMLYVMEGIAKELNNQNSKIKQKGENETLPDVAVKPLPLGMGSVK